MTQLDNISHVPPSLILDAIPQQELHAVRQRILSIREHQESPRNLREQHWILRGDPPQALVARRSNSKRRRFSQDCLICPLSGCLLNTMILSSALWHEYQYKQPNPYRGS